MSSRALTVALRLLTTTCAGVALGTMTGCSLLTSCRSGPVRSEPATMTTSDLLAFTELYHRVGKRVWTHLAVGTEGTVVVLGFDAGASGSHDFTEVHQVGSVPLRAALKVGGEWWVAGDAGTLAYTIDRGATWTFVELPSPASLHALVRLERSLLALGDEVVYLRTAEGSWVELDAPAAVGSWGRLRAAQVAKRQLHVVGLGGVVWSTRDPLGEWVAEDPGTSADLLGIGFDPDEQRVVATGTGGTVIERDAAGTWTPLDYGVSDDVLDWSGGAVLLADGRVLRMNERGRVSKYRKFVGARAFDYGFGAHTVVGDNGQFKIQSYTLCIGGRPFGTSDAPVVAACSTGPDWLAPSVARTIINGDADHELCAGQREALAAAWIRDGLYEHASIASFARFGAELLALGAPARLVAASSAAARDEVRHAQLCFGLAARFAAAPPRPAGLPLPTQLTQRNGDPAATALAVFEDGCLNESVAACMAADAAEACRDPATRATLEEIARDEAEHARLAWATLRWLLDGYGEAVAGPLRRRVAQLRVPSTRPSNAGEAGELDDLGAWGRLPAARQREVEGRVIAELVAPLAQRMVEAADRSDRPPPAAA